jgi:hypothetical protein
MSDEAFRRFLRAFKTAPAILPDEDLRELKNTIDLEVSLRAARSRESLEASPAGLMEMLCFGASKRLRHTMDELGRGTTVEQILLAGPAAISSVNGMGPWTFLALHAALVALGANLQTEWEVAVRESQDSYNTWIDRYFLVLESRKDTLLDWIREEGGNHAGLWYLNLVREPLADEAPAA